MFDMNKFEKEYRDFINQLRDRKNDNSIPIEIPEVKNVEQNNMNKKLSKIMQLRKDIKEGKMFTVYDGNGKFVWKKIR